MKARQTVSQHVAEHAHKQGTPTMGGLIVCVGFLGWLGFDLIRMRSDVIYDRQGLDGAAFQFFEAVFLLFGLFTLLGFVDDFVVPRVLKGKRGLGWTQKLAMQIVISILAVLVMGRSMPFWEAAAGVFSILFFSNAYNFADGLDWLAGMLLVGICLGLFFLGDAKGEPQFIFAGALLGATIPFLVLNRPPAKIFMGDVGSLPIGATLGVLVANLLLPHWSIMNHSESGEGPFVPGAAPTAALILAVLILSFVMTAELLPPPLQILSVKLRKKRLFPMTPIHHAFQKAGWKETRVVALFVGVQLACTLVASLIAEVSTNSTMLKRSMNVGADRSR